MIIPRKSNSVVLAAAALLLVFISCNFPLAARQPTPTPLPTGQIVITATQPPGQETPAPDLPSVTPQPTLAAVSMEELAAQVNLDRMLGHLDMLTHIQAYSGYRNSATTGELEGLNYIRTALQDLDFLMSLGLDFETQEFNVALATEIGEVSLMMQVGGGEFLLPANGLRGARDALDMALRMDTDGKVNGISSDPAVAEGDVLIILSPQDLDAVFVTGAQGKILLVDYSLIDSVIRPKEDASRAAERLFQTSPAGMLLVTQNSNQPGESHGTYLGEGGILANFSTAMRFPVIYARLEDLAPAGIQTMQELIKVDRIRLSLDADVLAPGTSHNLVAHIPGKDPSRAMILGAHIDSPNSPGASDNGSGSIILLEVAQLLDQFQAQPEIDLYLVWFGSEELGLYGSSHFVLTHQDLLDQTVAVMQVDCLTRPLDGLHNKLSLIYWPNDVIGVLSSSWTSFVSERSDRLGVSVEPYALYSLASDNSSFAGFNIPNFDLIYEDDQEMQNAGGVWYAGHIHDPYDTVEMVQDVGDVLVDMAKTAVAAVWSVHEYTPRQAEITSTNRRAVFVASHTEAVHMSPAMMKDISLVFQQAGFDVDVIPYGQVLTSDLIDSADVVVALPVFDYPSSEGDLSQYDESWQPGEIKTLVDYVDQGGMLVLTNSRYRMKYFNRTYEVNEDWSDMNALAVAFGIKFIDKLIPDASAPAEQSHALTDGVTEFKFIADNAVPFSMRSGTVLAGKNSQALLGVVSYGQSTGEVLVLADLGLFGSDNNGPTNRVFWLNLMAFLQSR